MRAKSNEVAYLDPVQSRRGRPRIKGENVKLASLFDTCKDSFVHANATLCGKEKSISCLCRDLLWGKKLYLKLRFVLVAGGSTRSIFASTNLGLSPGQIIRLYGYRFKIECCFRELKQVVGGLAYRFWSSSTPKLDKYRKAKDDILEEVEDEGSQARVAAAFKAINGYVMLSCIALGLLQICSLRFSGEVNGANLRWLRTRTNSVPSEATTAHYMGKILFRMFALMPNLDIIRLIRESKQDMTTPMRN